MCSWLILAKARGGYDNITLAVLPLEGRLHEESPAKPRPKKKTRSGRSATSSATRKGPKLSTGQRILVMMMLAVLGVLFAALFVVFALGN